MDTANANAPNPTPALDLTVTSGATRGWMARCSHSFTCHPHVYPRMEWAILHAFRKHSPDGVARARWRTSGSASYTSINPEGMKGWVGLVGWPYSGWFTHISGHPSAKGRAWDRESSPVKDRRSTTVPHSTTTTGLKIQDDPGWAGTRKKHTHCGYYTTYLINFLHFLRSTESSFHGCRI